MSNAFWIKWLRAIAILHVVGGIALSFDFPSIVWETYRADLYQIFNLGSEISDEVLSLTEMLIRLFGATVASWGVMMWILIGVIETHGIERFRIHFLSALLIWCITDCLLSYSYGVYSHLFINLAALTALLVPLYLIKPQQIQE